MRPSPAAACRYRAAALPGGSIPAAREVVQFAHDRGVSVEGELGGMNGTPVFVPADENYYKVWVDVSAQVTRTDVYRVDRRTGARELWNSTYATEDIQAVPEAVPVET